MTTPAIDYGEYNRLVMGALILQVDTPTSEQWRRGQAYFNILHLMRPDLAERVRGTPMDPFHQDDKIGDFLAWVVLHWGYENE